VRNLNNITGLLADFLYSINMPQVAPSFGEKEQLSHLLWGDGFLLAHKYNLLINVQRDLLLPTLTKM